MRPDGVYTGFWLAL